MIQLALYQPEIPQNTGNIIRLCAAAGAPLHIIEPCGFVWNDRRLRRAGLDYHEYARVQRHRDLGAFRRAIGEARIFAASTRGRQRHCDLRYRRGDVLLFGPETRGLPEALLAELGQGGVLRIPMLPERRSLNLANACAVVLYEAWRQLDFDGAA